MASERLLLVTDRKDLREMLASSLLEPAGYEVLIAENGAQGLAKALADSPHLIIADHTLADISALEMLLGIQETGPHIPAMLIGDGTTSTEALDAIRVGVVDYFEPPFDTGELLTSIHRQLDHETRRPHSIASSGALTALHDIGQAITSSLDLEIVLGKVVEEAVRLSNAEEGVLMLLDPETEELFTRASKSAVEDSVRNLRLPVNDSLAGQVVGTGLPMLVSEGEHKIKTEYLVKSLLYVPLHLMGQVIGVLGVSNRISERVFTQEDAEVLNVLANYSAIAISNARAFEEMHVERARFRTMLEQSSDAMLVVDELGYIVLINQGACEALNLDPLDVLGRTIDEAITNHDVHGIFERIDQDAIIRGEVEVSDGRTFNAQLTPIEGMGRVVVMQDVTHLKELDRMKTQFVTTVSHDLRSPLTAILGYIEFIGRVGELNTQQEDFVERVKTSVRAMTNLINDLLDLGRIEAGMDREKEPVNLGDVLAQVQDTLQASSDTKGQQFEFICPDNLPMVFGNPLRLRQALSNLVDNAIKYTPEGGRVDLITEAHGDHIHVRISDTGVGISRADQPYIFDQFYRAEDVQQTHVGTGLGLSIVKSIIESHEGRIWVESQPDEGTTFTVMLPIYVPGKGLTDSPHAP